MNYWGPRIIPRFLLKVIVGNRGSLPAFQFDWLPAQKPYDI